MEKNMAYVSTEDNEELASDFAAAEPGARVMLEGVLESVENGVARVFIEEVSMAMPTEPAMEEEAFEPGETSPVAAVILGAEE